MLSANELRIGNKVYYQSNILRITTISGIGGKTILNQYFVQLTETKEHPVIINHIEGISLTPEILEKCSKPNYYGKLELKIDKYHKIKNNYNNNKEHPDFSGPLCLYCEDDYYNIKAPLKYLHQLQNLYFALTGEELEINL